MIHFNNLTEEENELANEFLEVAEEYYQLPINNYEEFTAFYNLFVKLCNNHTFDINQLKIEF